MEGNTMSPTPTSPTEGDDPCEIDVTNVAIHSVTLLTCLCGLVGNGVVIWVVGFRIRSNSITVYILDLAVINFLFLLLALPSTLLFLLEDVSCSPIMSLVYLGILFQLSMLFFNVGLYWLTAISIERCRYILCPLCLDSHTSRCLPSGVLSALLWALSIAVVAVTATVTSLCLSHQQGYEHCRAALIATHTLNFLIFAPSVVISSTIFLAKLKCGSQQEQQRESLDIVIFLAVLFTLPLSLCNLLHQLGCTPLSSHVVFLLACINSTIKPFIYFSVGSSWRPSCSVESLKDSLQKVFEEPEENTPCSNGAAMNMAL